VTDKAPFPRLPEPPTDPGEYLTFFSAHIPAGAFDRDGNLVFKVVVAAEDKYKAMPLTDIRGRTFNITVHAPRGRTPLVRRGTLGVYDRQKSFADKKKDRMWRRAKVRYFDGEDEGVDE